jgi:hypothetical protein
LPITTTILSTSDNLLSSDDASFESSLGTWSSAVTGCSAVRESSWSGDGSYGLVLKNTSGVTNAMPATTGLYAVVPSQTYSVLATFHAESTGRTATLSIQWYNVSSALISTSTIGSTSDATARAVSGTAASPSNAAYAKILVSIASVASNEMHDVDRLGLFYGTISTWSAGGFVGASIAEVQRSIDGVTWTDVRNTLSASVGTNPETVSIIDYECPDNLSVQYRARVLSGGNASITSAWSNVQTVTLPATKWWILDPTTPSTAMSVYRVQSSSSAVNGKASIQLDRTDVQGISRPLGRSTAIVEHGDLWDEEFDLLMQFMDSASFQAFDALRSQQITVMLKSDMEGSVYYVSLGPDRPAVILSGSDRRTSPMRQVSIHCTPVDIP